MKGLLAVLIYSTAFAQQAVLTLREAEERALRQHPALQEARFQAAAVAELPKQAKASMFPILTGNFTGAAAPENSRLGAGAINNPVIFSRVAAGVSASQLLSDFGRTNHLVASLSHRAAAAGAGMDAVRNNLLLEVNSAYFAVLRAESVLRIARETVKARQIVADQVEALATARLRSELDLQFARLGVAEAELLVSSSDNERKSALASLASAMGEPNLDGLRLAEVSADVEPFALPELLREAMQNRPDLRARVLEREAAGELAESEKRLKYPAVAAVVSAGLMPLHASSLRGEYLAAGLNVGLPFLNGGLNRSKSAESLLKARAAAERVRSLRLEIQREVNTAVARVNTAADRIRLTGQLRNHAQLALDLAQSRYDLGLSSIVELMQAQLAATSAAIQSETATYEYRLHKAILDHRVGRR